MRAATDGTTDAISLTHTMDRWINHQVAVSGTSLTTITLLEDSDHVIRREPSQGLATYPFGTTWNPAAPGIFHIYAVAQDKISGNRVMSTPIILSSTTGTGLVPEIELADMQRQLLYSGNALNLSLSAVATDTDGYVQQVAFYVNGEQVGADTSSPYEASYDVNGSGVYEVYAVASDDDGNEITSTVQRIKVLEPGDMVEPISLSASSTTYLGGVADVSALYKSIDGSYDLAIEAHVYVNGEYAGEASKLPRAEPGLGEEDPGQAFTFDLIANAVGSQEVEFVIVNGDATASATVYVNVDESPLTGDLEFIRTLYQGLYDRAPESFEIGQFYTRMQSGELTRAQLIEELRSRGEFVKARDVLIAHKTIEGEWGKFPEALAKVENPVDAEQANNRPDDPSDNGTLVSMNEVINASIEVGSDIDAFRIRSLGSKRNGILTVTILGGHPGVRLMARSGPLIASGPSTIPLGNLRIYEVGSSGYGSA